MSAHQPQGLLLNRSGESLHVWSPQPYWPEPDCSLPTVVGPFARVNEWLEEVGLLRGGIKIIAGGTSFSFTQVIQAIDADGGSLATGSETALATTITFLGSGSGTGAGGFWSPGKTLGIHFRGALSSAASTPGNFNLNLRQTSTSGTSAGAQTAYAMATSLSASPIGLDAWITCRSDGSGGNVETCVDYLPGVTPAGGSLVELQASLSPASVGANTTAEQTIAFSGVLSTDIIVGVSKPTAQAGLGLVGWRVPSAGNVAFTYVNDTASPITPTASETYTIEVVRGGSSGVAVGLGNQHQLARANIGSFDTTANQLFVVSGLFSSWVSGDSVLGKLFFVEVLN